MRSDREEVPARFTKEQADEAEVKEARLSQQRAAVGCQVYWPSPNEVCGDIRDLYNFLGGPNSFLLFPKSNELVNPDGFGRRSEFLGGNIYWSPGTGAHYVAHDFLTKWGQYGYESGYMKYPTTDEIINPDGIGRRQEFQGGTIQWSPASGAHTINGRIKERWGQLGYEGGEFGYPTTDEMAPTGYWATRAQIEQRFQRGALFYNIPTNTVIDGLFQITIN